MSPFAIISLTLLCLLAPLSAQAITPGELQQIRDDFQIGRKDEDMNIRTLERLQQALEQEPDHPVLLAYLGSSQAIRGGFAWLPWKKLGYVNDGIAHMQRALRQAEKSNTGKYPAMVSPLDEVRLILATTYLELPSMFETETEGRQLLDQLLASAANSQWPDDFRRQVLELAKTTEQQP
jgi:hypothetical protein